MLQLKVEGMSCGHCVKAVSKAVGSVQPGAKVDIDLASGQVTVASTDQAQAISAAIEEAGYTVLSSALR